MHFENASCTNILCCQCNVSALWMGFKTRSFKSQDRWSNISSLYCFLTLKFLAWSHLMLTWCWELSTVNLLLATFLNFLWLVVGNAQSISLSFHITYSFLMVSICNLGCPPMWDSRIGVFSALSYELSTMPLASLLHHWFFGKVPLCLTWTSWISIAMMYMTASNPRLGALSTNP